MNFYLISCKKISSWLLLISSIGLIVMTAIIIWQIFGRFFLNDTPNWSEKLSIFLLNWYVLLGVAVGVHEDFHLGLIFLKNGTSGVIKKVINSSIHLLLTIFAGYMFYYGIVLMKQTWTHTIPALGISTAFSYLPLSISAIFIAVFSLEHLIKANTQEGIL